MPRYRLTTWYYAYGIDDALHRVPARVPEQLVLGSEELAGPPRPEWVREFGGVILLGAVVALDDGWPQAFVGMGSGLLRVRSDSPKEVPFEPGQWETFAERMARTTGHRAGVPQAAIPALETYLREHRMALPLAGAAAHFGFSLGELLFSWSASVSAGRWDRWDMATGQAIVGTNDPSRRPPRDQRDDLDLRDFFRKTS